MVRKFLVIGLGEVLWDLFPYGKKLGGATANFAYHISSLGHTGIIISRVGTDDLGRDILDHIDNLGLNKEYIQMDQEHPTSTVEVEVDQAGHPTYAIVEDVAWDFICSNKKSIGLAEKADIICFGTLAQRSQTSRYAIKDIINASGPDTVRVFDINLRQSFYSRKVIDDSLKLSTILKLNDEELEVIKDLFDIGRTGTDIHFLRSLLAEYGIKLICLTRGSKGSLVLDKNDIYEHPGYKVDVVDSVGSGDAFTAGLAMSYLKGMSLEEISNTANMLGSWVASKPGGTPGYDDILLEKIKNI